jgi:putative oxidoreductase
VLKTLVPYLLTLLRVAASLLFMMHGTQKLFGWPSSQPRSPVDLFTQMGLAGVLEAFGGLFLLLGLFTRPVAFLLAGEMAYAYFQSHMPRGLWPILNGGELAVLYGSIWLYFAAEGAGPFSLDAVVRRRR